MDINCPLQSAHPLAAKFQPTIRISPRNGSMFASPLAVVVRLCCLSLCDLRGETCKHYLSLQAPEFAVAGCSQPLSLLADQRLRHLVERGQHWFNKGNADEGTWTTQSQHREWRTFHG